MKKNTLAVFAIAALIVAGCGGNKDNNGKISTDVIKMEGDLPVMTFNETQHDFGTITEGEKVSYVFNTKYIVNFGM